MTDLPQSRRRPTFTSVTLDLQDAEEGREPLANARVQVELLGTASHSAATLFRGRVTAEGNLWIHIP
jgi:hypothetical protein